jgi:hypothetical protein
MARNGSSFMTPQQSRIRAADGARMGDWAAANARGLSRWPGIAYDYASTNTPYDFANDVGGILGSVAQSAWEDPAGFAADMTPGLGEARTAAEADDLYAKIREARAAGDEETASSLENMLPLMSLGAVPIVGGLLAPGKKLATEAVEGAVENTVKSTTKKAAKDAPKRMTDLPDLRTMPVADAVKVANKEPHLIPSPDSAEGAYIGGPRSIQTRLDLLRMRRELDKTVEAEPRGGDWYDRYRAGVNEVTGGDPRDNTWFANTEGQYSAGVSPQSELAFSLKDTLSSIAYGQPVKAARPAQKQATMRAIAANDPTKFQLGKKTGEYARRVNPNQPGPATATGVNDFRHARNLGYTEPDGTPQKNALGGAAHTFSDYETALAVGRANKKKLAGRSDWTGEQLQAAPWVSQKADDLWSRESKKFTALAQRANPGASDADVYAAARELAFQEANKTITEHFPKHTAFATYEAQPGAMTGHLPGSVGSSRLERDLYANDTRSAWNTAPGGRDALYAGMRLGDTGKVWPVRPTQNMQGMYTPEGGPTEFNPGFVARPLVDFQTGDVKSVTPWTASMMDGVEATRALIDAQGAGAWHKNWVGGAPGQSTSMVIDKKVPGILDPDEMLRMQKAGAEYGLPDIVDTNEGVTMTRFYPGPPEKRGVKDQRGLEAAIQGASDNVKGASKSKVDSGYIGYEKAWTQPGKGGATRKLLRKIDDMPRAAQEALDANSAVPKAALDRLERDNAWSKKWGATRQDIQNLRKIVGEGPGWIKRLRLAERRGALLPAAVGALIGASAMQEANDEQ